MLRVLACLRDQHDYRLVLLALFICAAASGAAVFLVRHARSAQPSRWRWVGAAGLGIGVGIWSTHFVAMLAFDPHVGFGFRAGLTFLSLAMAIGLTACGVGIALHAPVRGRGWIGGLVVSAGIASMHYTGMAALELPGFLVWDRDLILFSIVAGAVFTVPAVRLATLGRGRRSGLGAALLLVLGIGSHHFIGMGAVTVLRTAAMPIGSDLLSPESMAIIIALVAAMVIALTVVVAVLRSRAQSALRSKEREFRTLVQGITDCALYTLGVDGRVANWNAGAERLTGYTAEEAVGLPLSAFHVDGDRSAGELATAAEAGKYVGEGWRRRKDGSRFWANVTIERVLDEQGHPCGYAQIVRDMTQAKADADRLSEAAINLDAALSNMHQGLCLFDADERLVLSNTRVGEMFGITAEECPPGTQFREVLRLGVERLQGCHDEAVLDEVYARHKASLAQPGGGTVTIEIKPEIVVEIRHRPRPDGGWVTTFEDITERRRSAAQIEHMAKHDALTGLPNRAFFNQRLDVELHRASGDTRVAAIAIDLDRFKEINDSRGHAVGDEMLCLLGRRLAQLLAGDEFAARLGGDEFALIKPFKTQAELNDLVRRVEKALLTPVMLTTGSLPGGASIGVAVSPQDGNTREALMNNADLAMYRAKSTIGQHVAFYEPRMDEQARIRRALASDLRAGLARGEFHLAYQVQKSLETGEVIGHEALLRWEHPVRGSIPPSEFIPVAEESGAILELGEWALRRACADAAGWHEGYKIAVNLSPLQFAHPDLPGLIRSVLVETGLSPRRLELEITESTLIGDKVRGLHILRQIKALGVTIAIDDFGTGYSSLDTLNSFPFDKIKIDRSFLAEALANPQAHAIIRAVLALGRSMGVPVLAEGIETEAQLALLRSDGCEEGQGFLFGRPRALTASEAGRRAA